MSTQGVPYAAYVTHPPTLLLSPYPRTRSLIHVPAYSLTDLRPWVVRGDALMQPVGDVVRVTHAKEMAKLVKDRRFEESNPSKAWRSSRCVCMQGREVKAIRARVGVAI